MRSTWAVLLFLAGPLHPAPSDSSYFFKHLSTTQGLSSNQVNAICRDRQGFVWIGTRDGLNRFDGLEFKTFLPDSKKTGSISDNFITAIYADRGGTVWVGTLRGGLNRFDPVTETFFHYRSIPRNRDSISSDDIKTIVKDRTGNLYVGTYGGGLNCLDHRTGKFRRFQHDRQNLASIGGNYISSLCADRTGALWIGTLDGGLSRLSAGDDHFTRFLPRPGDPTGINDRVIAGILEEPRSGLWILTRTHGLNRFNHRDQSFTRFPLDSRELHGQGQVRFNSLAADPNGKLWIGTSRGIYLFDPVVLSFSRIGADQGKAGELGNTKITSVLVDPNGITWLGTDNDGVHYLVQDLAGFFIIQPDPNNRASNRNTVLAIAEDRQGGLWLGSSGGGLLFLDRAKGEFMCFTHDAADRKSLAGNVVTAILEDHLGTLWIGTWGNGLDLLSSHSHEFVHVPCGFAWVFSLIEDRQGNVWIGSKEGLFRFDRRRNIFSRMMPGSVRTLLEDRAGLIWVGMIGNGLSRIDPRTDEISSFKTALAKLNRSQSSDILSLCQSRDGAIWVGTEGAGLFRIEPGTDAFTHIGQTRGLPGDSVSAILSDPAANLWLSFPRNLARFDPVKGTFRNFDFDDRLPGLEFRYGVAHKSRSGELFFGGIQGVVSFSPEVITAGSPEPPVVITAHSFNPTENRFQVQFAVLDYVNPGRNRYAYKLEGYDRDWISATAGERKAVYTNLASGRYTFRVRGAGSGGTWNLQGANLDIVVPFSTAKWLWLLLIPALAAWPLVRWLRQRKGAVVTQPIENKVQYLDRFLDRRQISSREREIIALIVAGRSNREIEDILFISMNTVKNHIYHIYRKLGINSRTRLISLIERERHTP